MLMEGAAVGEHCPRMATWLEQPGSAGYSLKADTAGELHQQEAAHLQHGAALHVCLVAAPPIKDVVVCRQSCNMSGRQGECWA